MNDNDDAGWDESGSDVGRPATDQMRARGDDGGWVSSEWFTESPTEQPLSSPAPVSPSRGRRAPRPG